MEVFVQLGYFGFVIYMALFLYIAYRATQNAFSAKGIEQRLPLLLIVFLITSNIGETFYLGMIGPNINLFIVVVLAIKLGHQHSKLPKSRDNPYLIPR
jgi:O-antigen ligase